MDSSKVFLPYHTFMDLDSGTSPTAKWEVIEEIKRGKTYIVTLEGKELILSIDNDNNFVLIDQASESYSLIIEVLKSFRPDQPFTTHEVLRKIGESKGEGWAGIFEVAKAEELEKYLLENKLIKEYGTVKTFKKS